MDLHSLHNQSLIEHLGYFHSESLKYFDEKSSIYIIENYNLFF